MLRKVRDLHDRCCVHILDLALAMRADGNDFAYKGGLVNLNSPEVCAELLSGSADIPIDTRLEVYSAAAVIFFLHNGRTPADYGTDDYAAVSMMERLRCTADGCRNTFSRAAAESFLELECALD